MFLKGKDEKMICITFVFTLLLCEAWSVPGTQWRVSGGDQERQATQFRPTRDLEIEDRMSEIRSQVNGSSTLISQDIIFALQINETQLNFIEETEGRIDPGYKDQRRKIQQRKNRKKGKNKKRTKKGKGNRLRALKGENDIVDNKGSQERSGESIAGEDEKVEEPMDERNEREGEKDNDYDTETDISQSIEIENNISETNTVDDATTEEMNNDMEVAAKESGWWERRKMDFPQLQVLSLNSSIIIYRSNFQYLRQRIVV